MWRTDGRRAITLADVAVAKRGERYVKFLQLLRRHVRMRALLRRVMHELWSRSIRRAVSEQSLAGLKAQLEKIVLNLSDIRTTYRVDGQYQLLANRCLDAFQVSLAQRISSEFDTLAVADVGDSSGRHLLYLRHLRQGRTTQCFSVNLDPVAVERIRQKGIEAVCAPAEEVGKWGKRHIDIVMCFEVLEHVMDPCFLLHQISYGTDASYLVMTVPYVRSSRVSLLYVRGNVEGAVHPEGTHVFELNPDDWKALARHSGWEVVAEEIYFQYPKRSVYWLTKPLWATFDFEGYLGLILKRDHSYSDRFQWWPRRVLAEDE